MLTQFCHMCNSPNVAVRTPMSLNMYLFVSLSRVDYYYCISSNYRVQRYKPPVITAFSRIWTIVVVVFLHWMSTSLCVSDAREIESSRNDIACDCNAWYKTFHCCLINTLRYYFECRALSLSLSFWIYELKVLWTLWMCLNDHRMIR